VVQANLLAAEAPDANGQAMNIGCGERISLNDVLRIAGELIGTEVQPIYTAPRAGDVRDSLADISRATRLLGYHPTISFRDGLANTLAALRDSMAVAK
jgi:nucleoside-diphosphate-sugar epimerase